MVAVVLVVVLLQPTWGLPTAFTEGVDPQLLESCLQLFENWTVLQLLLIHVSINMPRVLSFHYGGRKTGKTGVSSPDVKTR